MSKHGDAVAKALEGEAPPVEAPATEEASVQEDAFTLGEDELALLNLFDDTSVEESDTSPPTGEIPKAEEAPPEVKADEPKVEEPEVVEQKVEDTPPEPPKIDESEDDTPSLDLTSQVEETKAPEAEAKTNEELEAERAKWREESLSKIEDYYSSQLSDEDKDLLLTEPDKVLPRLLARSYLDMYDSLMAGMTQQMPQQVTQLMETQKATQKAESAFFEKWPQLKSAAAESPEKAQILQRTVQAYRQLNPNAPLEQAITESGAMAMVALKIPLDVDKPAEPEVVEKPFTPATPGGGGAQTPSAPKELNPYEQLAQELVDDGEM